MHADGLEVVHAVYLRIFLPFARVLTLQPRSQLIVWGLYRGTAAYAPYDQFVEEAREHRELGAQQLLDIFTGWDAYALGCTMAEMMHAPL